MVVNKQKELNGGRAMFTIGSRKADTFIARTWNTVVYMVTHVSVQSCKRITIQTVLKAERFFISKLEQVGQRFSMAGNMVTGYNLPRNRGSVSFFLKNIEDHKKTMRKAPVHLIK
jgi:hypothetical protein